MSKPDDKFTNKQAFGVLSRYDYLVASSLSSCARFIVILDLLGFLAVLFFLVVPGLLVILDLLSFLVILAFQVVLGFLVILFMLAFLVMLAF